MSGKFVKGKRCIIVSSSRKCISSRQHALPNLLNCRADLLIKGVTPAARREKCHGVLVTVGCCGVIRLRVSPQGAQRQDGYGGVLRTVGTEYWGAVG